MRKALWMLLIFLPFLLSLNRVDAGFCPKLKTFCPCWGDGRRPQVMVSQKECCIDYNEGCCFELQSRPREVQDNIPVTPEMLRFESSIVRDFKLSKGDTLEISIFGDEETFVSSTTIAPDGGLYYGFLERIQAAGLTPKQLAQALEEKLDQLFVNPKVSIVPKTLVTQSYKILGRVVAPGVYPIEGPIRLREAIGEAGGLQQESFRDKSNNARLNSLVDLSSSYMIRDGKRLGVDFSNLLNGADNHTNVFMKAGDYIYIAPAQNFHIYVAGNVNGPTRLTYRQGTTLMAALAQGGGWTTPNPYSPNLTKVVILRGCIYECRPNYLIVDVQKILLGEARDVYLCPGDIIYVPNKKFRFVRELILLAFNSFVQAFAGSAAATFASTNWFPVSSGVEVAE